MPGTDPAEAMRIILGELPDLPHLPELPARGPGADLTGRTAALLIDLPVETTPGGWRLADRQGRDLRRARGMLSADLDALEEVLAGYSGPLKVQVCGPWTLAATIERSRSQEPVLSDPGAVRDLTESLAEGVAAHMAEIGKRVPGARVLLQLDEPALPAVVEGRVPSASGLSRFAAVEAGTAAGRLRTIVSAARSPAIVHCCAIPLPFGIIKEAGAAAVSLDLSLLGRADEDALAEVADAGLGILAGAVPSADIERASQPGTIAGGDTASVVIDLWRRMGFPARRCTEQVVITPACGLVGASPAYARAALARCREAARLLPELIEEGMS